MKLPAGTKKRIAVHSQLIKQHDPVPMRVHVTGKSIPARFVTINGKSTVYYGEPNMLCGGARAYIETTSEVDIDNGFGH